MVFGLLYVICILVSNYRGLFETESWFVQLFVYFYPGTMYHSFPTSLLFLSVGKIISENGFDGNLKKWGWLATCSLLLLCAEYVLIDSIGCMIDNDCYFMLIPCCIFLALFTFSWSIKIKFSSLLRSLSTINYVMHGSVIFIIEVIMRTIGNTIPIIEESAIVKYSIRFLGTELICFSVGLVILYIENRYRVKFLKFMH